MTVHLKAIAGGSIKKYEFESPEYELHDTIFELDAKQELIRVIKSEFLLVMMKEFGYETASDEANKTYDFIKFLEEKVGLPLKWETGIWIDGKAYDYLNKKFY